MHSPKTFVVTGASQGIGLETVRRLVESGHRVLLTARSPEKVRSTIDNIKSTHPDALVEGYVADMSLQRDIRKAAEAMLAKNPVIDGLINNVGTWMSNHSLTAEGIETVYATNHLSYVLMTHLLYPALKRSGHGRIINVASKAHSYGKINIPDPGYSKNYHGLRSNGQSKLANLYFTFELDALKPDANISVYAVSPGLVKTDIGLKHTNWLHTLAWKFRRRKGQTPSDGARTSVFCATDLSVENISGKYWEHREVKDVFPSAKDPVLGKQLWDLSNRMCGIEDYFYEKTAS
ncbi:MAG TPA: SDR family NAD(P)-dependent oxidoreductase [Saprospiraceae bacterium]|nr:SDR family NAD(P)-dependent oxidoreductase [Saprospiraceae bacterium]